MKAVNLCLAISVLMVMGMSKAWALIPNGDFETGDLTGYQSYEGLVPVATSDFVQNVDDGTGNRVGQLTSGSHITNFSNYNLGKNLGKLPDDVQDLYFDVKFTDLGLLPGANGSSNRDFLATYLYMESITPRETFNLVYLDNEQLFEFNPDQTSTELLSNGFYRIKTDMKPFVGKEDVQVRFELWDRFSPYLSEVQIDNIKLTTLEDPDPESTVAPEPSTMLLLGGGLAGLLLKKRRRI